MLIFYIAAGIIAAYFGFYIFGALIGLGVVHYIRYRALKSQSSSKDGK